MSKCGYCGSTILMGGVRAGGQVFCNRKCFQDAHVLTASQQIPSDVLDQKVQEVWAGNCPECKGPGPADLHKAYQVWSAIVTTRWSTKPRICCRSCATKRQIAGAVSSLIVGWWGIPWGLILTPVQIARDIAGIFGGPDKSRPSEGLRRAVLVTLGKRIAANQAPPTPATTPPLPPPLPPQM